MQVDTILTRDEMKEAYGSFYTHSSNAECNPDDVPQNMRCLIPYAEFWALPECGDHSDLFDAASGQVRQNLCNVVNRFNDEADEWLAGSEATSDSMTDAYIAFSQLWMAVDLC